MKTNPFYIIWAIVTLLLAGAAGFFLFSSKSAYDSTKDTFDDNEGSISRLEKKVPFPSKANVEEMEALVEEYKGAVDGLYDALAVYQRPLSADLQDDQFQKLVSDKLTAFVAAAKSANLTIKGKDKFYIGMEKYRGTLPAPENVPLLAFELEAIDRLLAILVESGADQLLSLTRELIPGELANANTANGDDLSVKRYELRLEFVADHDAYQKFVNAITNDEQFFFILRLLRIDNSSPTGIGGKNTGGGLGGDMAYVDDEGNSPSPEVLAEIEEIDDIEERINMMQARGYRPVSEDAKTLLGEETLRVFAVIDVARFLTPEEKVNEEQAGAAAR